MAGTSASFNLSDAGAIPMRHIDVRNVTVRGRESRIGIYFFAW